MGVVPNGELGPKRLHHARYHHNAGTTESKVSTTSLQEAKQPVVISLGTIVASLVVAGHRVVHRLPLAAP